MVLPVLPSAPLAAPNARRALRLQEFPVCAGQRRSHPVEVCSLAAERKDLLGVLLHRRTASAARQPVRESRPRKTVRPPDRGTDADVELFSRFTAGICRSDKAQPSRLTRIWSRHRQSSANQCVRLANPRVLGIPIHWGRGHAVARRSPRKASYSRAGGSPIRLRHAADVKENLLKATTLIAPHQLARHADGGKPAVAHNGHVVA
jgi:hypothetical protein